MPAHATCTLGRSCLAAWLLLAPAAVGAAPPAAPEADVCNYANGEYISAALRRFYLMALAQQSRPLLQKLIGIDGDLARHAMRMQEMTAATQAGDAARATGLIEKAIEALPNLLQLYWVRVSIALDAKKHADTAAWLDVIAERFGLEFADLEEVPEDAEFVKSPEYRDWKARRDR